MNFNIDKNKFGKIYSFVDFGNVNHWFDDDIRDWLGNFLKQNSKLKIDLEKLFNFTNNFSNQIRFYYGHDPENFGSLKFIGKAKYVFGERLVFTKPIQQVKHYLKDGERIITTRRINHDG